MNLGKPLQLQTLASVLFLLALSFLYFRPYKTEKVVKVQKTNYHHNVWHEYSIKPVAFVFPQYYAFSENDKIWGINFTEWDNVRKATHNAHGLETIRPAESVGYYDGLEFATRRRQGNFLRDHGFYGMAFHHYWFAGKPVMDAVIQQMLIDGEPNIPFLLSWANEPWTARWDGDDSGKVYIAQTYGLVDEWRAHFDWLLPFFRHPQYIRSEGRVQFNVYKPTHIGKAAPAMFAAWRQWAIEEGLGGLDVIETRWNAESWSDFPPDAVSEFQPHVMGFDHSRHSMSRRIARVYHRGTLVCWDSTPRHVQDGGGDPQPLCHPKTWQWNVVEMFRRIKQDPNPIGAENFLFINALNEWGEGNALEPSMQFGDGYGVAMKNAVAISEREHVWTKDFIAEQQMINRATKAREKNETADVCVLVRTCAEHAADKTYKLGAMLESLQKQSNPNWRAIVYQTDKANFGSETLAFRSLDQRVAFAKVPEHLLNETLTLEASYPALDWVMQRLDVLDPVCAKARYLLLADGGNTYAPAAFSAFAGYNSPADIYALTVESRQTIKNEEDDRMEDLPAISICLASSPTSKSFDLSATFFHLPKFRAHNITLTNLTSPYLLAEWLITSQQWSWASAATPSAPASCDVFHNPTYSTCIRSGNFWFDTPNRTESRCYSVGDFSENFKMDHNMFDLVFYRQHALCIRYTIGQYEEKLNASREEERAGPLALKALGTVVLDDADVDVEKKEDREMEVEGYEDAQQRSPVVESWKQR
ncbi:MAG: hypothetical protein M1818_001175 [Claussenomyces sp. TS43310]|nr:MAG: hypothetical protein M1818_001175 [Claussenomyces sp. TS43310]